MHSRKLLYKGTVVRFCFKSELPKELRSYMLVEYVGTEPEIAFQLVCIAGYKSGTVYTYIKKDREAELAGSRAVSRDHLEKEIIRMLGDFYKTSFKILPKPDGLSL